MSYNISTCLCGFPPQMETGNAPERIHTLHRIACCFCGLSSPNWSTSTFAAIFLWNRFMAYTLDELFTA